MQQPRPTDYNPFAAPESDFEPTIDQQPFEDYVPASLVKRLFATLLDAAFRLLLLPVSMLLCVFIVYLAATLSKAIGTSDPLEFLMMGICLLIVGSIDWTYSAYPESLPAGATLGKRLLGIRVVTLEGQRINLWQTTLRYITKNAFAALYGLPMVTFFFTERKQTAHDMFSKTVVVMNRTMPSD